MNVINMTPEQVATLIEQNERLMAILAERLAPAAPATAEVVEADDTPWNPKANASGRAAMRPVKQSVVYTASFLGGMWDELVN